MEKAPPTKRPLYDAGFRAESFRLVRGSRYTLVAALTLNINANKIYAWQKAARCHCPSTRLRLLKCGLVRHQ